MIGIVSTVGNDGAALPNMTLKAVTGLGNTCLQQAGQLGCPPSGADGQGGPRLSHTRCSLEFKPPLVLPMARPGLLFFLHHWRQSDGF